MDSASLSPHFEDDTATRRRAQEVFIARALRSSDDARRTSSYHSAEAVHAKLQQLLDARRMAVLG